MTVVVWGVDVSATEPLSDGVSDELVSEEPACGAVPLVLSSSFSVFATSAEKRYIILYCVAIIRKDIIKEGERVSCHHEHETGFCSGVRLSFNAL